MRTDLQIQDEYLAALRRIYGTVDPMRSRMLAFQRIGFLNEIARVLRGSAQPTQSEGSRWLSAEEAKDMRERAALTQGDSDVA